MFDIPLGPHPNHFNNLPSFTSLRAVLNSSTRGRQFFLNLDLESRTSKGYTTLMLAAYNGHYKLTQELISRGADVNSVDQSGNSILMGVVFKGNNLIFNLLIASKANFDYQNPKNETALDYAIMFGRRDLITHLNRLMSTDRTDGKVEQMKTWARHINRGLQI